MDVKKEIDVLINKKKYTICTSESEEYVQKLVSYLNNRYQELKSQDGYNSMPPDIKEIFLEINLADEYFKLKKVIEEQQASEEEKNKELFRVTHDLMEAQNQVKKLTKELEDAKHKQIETDKKIVRLETELSERGYKKNSGR